MWVDLLYQPMATRVRSHASVEPETLRIIASGHAGLPDSAWLDDQGRTLVVWPVSVDSALNRSCRGDSVVVTGSPLDVEGETMATGKEELYDLAGRKVQRPLKSGVYFRRMAGQARGKIVVIR